MDGVNTMGQPTIQARGKAAIANSIDILLALMIEHPGINQDIAILRKPRRDFPIPYLQGTIAMRRPMWREYEGDFQRTFSCVTLAADPDF